MKVLLISCQENADILGVKYLHAYISSKGHESTILLVPHAGNANVQAILKYIQSVNPGIIGFSAMTYEISRVRELAIECRKLVPRCPIVIGGVHATSDYASCLEFSDIVVRGEGEETLAELLTALENASGLLSPGAIEHIAGIAYIKDNKVVLTPVRQPCHDVDSLPVPRHRPDKMLVVHEGSLHSLKERSVFRKFARYQGTFLSILASRGCPFSCSYCCNSMYKSLYGGTTIRKRSAGSVIQEITGELREFKGILYVNFADDCFLMNSLEWLSEFSERYTKEIGIPFIIRTTPKHVTAQKLSILKSAGLRWVFMGLQTGSDRINEEVYHRRVTAQEFLAAAKVISDFNLSAWYDVILDNPYETEEDSLKTVAILLQTPRPFQLDLFSLDFFPGTELRQRALREKLPIPAPGEKSYTRPDPVMINRIIRMSATLPPGLVRLLIYFRRTFLGKVLGWGFYGIALMGEPIVYLRLIHKSNDYKLSRTLCVAKAFAATAISKLYLRHQG